MDPVREIRRALLFGAAAAVAVGALVGHAIEVLWCKHPERNRHRLGSPR